MGKPPVTMPVTIQVDAGQIKGELRPIWRYYGADEPNYAPLPNGRKLLGELGKIEPKPAFFRTHNLLTTGDGTPALKWGSTNAYTEDDQGNPIYDWTIVDSILEAGLTHGVKPYVQLGFMPKALRSSRSRISTAGRRRPNTTRFTRAGRIRPKTTPNGANWRIS
jgi:xylan 1,4-beta-xylosidase